MKDFWYWEPIFNGELNRFALHKILLVKNEDDILVGKFDLTMMGLEEANTYDELIRQAGEENFFKYFKYK